MHVLYDGQCCLAIFWYLLSFSPFFGGGGTYFLKNSKDFYLSSRGMGSSILSTQNKMMATFP